MLLKPPWWQSRRPLVWIPLPFLIISFLQHLEWEQPLIPLIRIPDDFIILLIRCQLWLTLLINRLLNNAFSWPLNIWNLFLNFHFQSGSISISWVHIDLFDWALWFNLIFVLIFISVNLVGKYILVVHYIINISGWCLHINLSMWEWRNWGVFSKSYDLIWLLRVCLQVQGVILLHWWVEFIL